MPKPTLAVRVMAVALVALLLPACSRGGIKAPEARLGSPPAHDSARQGYGPDGPRGPAPGSQQDLKSSGDDTIYFSTDSVELTPEAQATLASQAEWLQRHAGRTITIEGHADERGTREYNIALGARRATAARGFLIARGVDPARIRTTSYGKERPVAVCNDISCWSLNRRAQTILGSPALSRS